MLKPMRDSQAVCFSSQTVSKYNSQYHKLFSAVPKEEILMKVYSCALLRDILLQGRLYISRNWLCFYANLFGKDIKVAIPVVSVRLVKKHKTAGLVPNGLAITTDTSQKYVFVSLLSRDSVYDVLRRICTHLQVNGKKSLSLKQYLEEPGSLSTETVGSVRIVIAARPAGKLHEQPERRRRAHYFAHHFIVLSGVSGLQSGTAAVLPQHTTVDEHEREVTLVKARANTETGFAIRRAASVDD
ncbi:GRAM domain-containing protein 2A [Labeo rohita]|uniref:GRAM domain-containing protein 2A n=1 Tax=Labeo rohita TaxID=84645 RepID=A0ABQ8LFZ8_LABRO|nr:GRAM domain-containing protein 2A [Labeo rohita]